MEEGLRSVLADLGIAGQVSRVGSMFCLYFTDAPVRGWADAALGDAKRFRTYFHKMLGRGIYLAPSAFEAGFISSAHSESDIDETIAAAGESLR